MRPIVFILIQIINLYMYLLIASAILSWLIAFNVVNTRNQFVSAIAEFLYRITEPVLGPIRRRLPSFGGLDISPIIAFFILWLIQLYLAEYVYPFVP
ncbi:YggT family protein [Bradyrhizobium erythrophlei]|jgi:YggT family protein|uniref:YggT family protein n=1 Tax=Bradyrhizobium erythrophlei TaxID=1437360 RepID=A0A1M5JBA1_9BRAD|nr:YggT family protein [Bradyrhizobium erythrophlei]SHG37655.1 YggT family protein [Bradyrhizobium erythrophlei]